MKKAIFWGNERINYKEEPIICEEGEVEKICEDLIVDAIKNWQKTEKGYVKLLPGIFHVLDGKEEDLKKHRIDNYPIDDAKMMPTFIFLTDAYDSEQQKVVATMEDVSIAWNIIDFSVQKKNISLRLDKGLVKALRGLTKRKVGEYIHLELAEYIINNHLKNGNLKKKIGHPFFICISYTNLMTVTEKKFMLGDKELELPEYKENGATVLVNYGISKILLQSLKKMSERDGRTVTDLIKEAISKGTKPI